MSLHQTLTGTRPALPPLIEEAPVALTCDGSTLAVMMATPDDLSDFALGFTLTEGILQSPDELRELEIVHHADGMEARMWLAPEASHRVMSRQRAMVGPVGCGLCGIDSLAKVARDLPALPAGPRFDVDELAEAPDQLRNHQPRHDRTRACHGAGFLVPGRGIALAREDVGRHNALDKLAGALCRAGLDPAQGAVVISSRVSAEMVQKTVAIGATALVAPSAATDYALRIAQSVGLTLVARGSTRELSCLVGSARVDWR
ncbi:formate dehydrogenase accessory sulfurtransferase FdhD [Alloyangia pacifica]|uniref:formate dehydrogenase accessory sulfurtransferase FdhD n=1 Tax=Alloyangia pacifica TaxID=311180 RepID=UPI001CD7755D|nr:formate dehydrogenase accessory sulfurtransferase FdhD [Alloyangia pacifica]MCA0998597.1 formate dehydrogenase accessory sulfurtransferase FdhD [Alloyangia pacifica]